METFREQNITKNLKDRKKIYAFDRFFSEAYRSATFGVRYLKVHKITQPISVDDIKKEVKKVRKIFINNNLINNNCLCCNHNEVIDCEYYSRDYNKTQFNVDNVDLKPELRLPKLCKKCKKVFHVASYGSISSRSFVFVFSLISYSKPDELVFDEQRQLDYNKKR